MTEEKKKKLRGFASTVAKLVDPLNENEKFKERFKDTKVKILLNAKDGKYAALLIIDKATIHVEGIENKPKKNLKKKVVGWDGLFQTSTPLFLEILGGDEVSMGKIIRKVLIGKIKIRGIKKVLILLQLFDL
ncbi:MAG: hypothetical protein ACFFAQ_05920 [Promethearchaeota archaeon]